MKNNFKNHAVNGRYKDERRVDYEELPKNQILDSMRISFSCIDSYSVFDLSITASELDDQEYENFTEYGVEVDYEAFDTCELDTENLTYEMAVKSVELLTELAREDGKEIEMEVVAVYSPSEYNFTTDSYEALVKKNPFESVEKLESYLKTLIYADAEQTTMNDDYFYEMLEFVELYLNDNIIGYNIRTDDGNIMFTYDEMVKKFAKK